MSRMTMTDKQRELARHALGLNDGSKPSFGRRQSYRNRFVAGPGHDDYQDWCALVGRGLAMGKADAPMLAGSTLFWLTREGAELALNPGETLDPEDFPQPQEGKSQ